MTTVFVRYRGDKKIAHYIIKGKIYECVVEGKDKGIIPESGYVDRNQYILLNHSCAHLSGGVWEVYDKNPDFIQKGRVLTGKRAIEV